MGEHLTTKFKKLIGKKVEWEEYHDYNRGTCLVRTGKVEDVKGKNVWIDGEPKWAPDLKNIKVIENE